MAIEGQSTRGPSPSIQSGPLEHHHSRNLRFTKRVVFPKINYDQARQLRHALGMTHRRLDLSSVSTTFGSRDQTRQRRDLGGYLPDRSCPGDNDSCHLSQPTGMAAPTRLNSLALVRRSPHTETPPAATGGALKSREANQPKLTVILRRRIAPPIRPNPPSIIAQDAGSGTEGGTSSWTDTLSICKKSQYPLAVFITSEVSGP